MSFFTEFGLRVKSGSRFAKWIKRNHIRLIGVVVAHKKKPKPPVPVKVYMYDDINVDLIPKDAVAVAGYIGGRWPTYPKVVAGWPKAKHLSIAVSTAYDADVLDVEPGDATPDQAAAWVKRQLKVRATGRPFNSSRPVVYTNASHGQALVDKLEAAGLKYGQDFLWWSAHYDPAKGEHNCSPKCGFGIKVTAHATQFTDMAGGKNLDESVVLPGFFH